MSFALAAVGGSTLGAKAFLAPDEIQHFEDCLDLLLTDSVAHRDQCSPFKGSPPDYSLVSGQGPRNEHHHDLNCQCLR